MKLAEGIYSPTIYALKGKTVNRKVDHVITPVTSIPKQILKEYKHITLCIDVMFINCIKFLLTVSWHIDFVTAKYVPSKKYTWYIKPIEMVCNMYTKRWFVVIANLADPRFKHSENSSTRAVNALATLPQIATPRTIYQRHWRERTCRRGREKDLYRQRKSSIDASYYSNVTKDPLNVSYSPDWCRLILA